MEDIIKIVRCLECPGLLLKGVSETIQNEAKEEKGRFLGMLLGTLGVSLLINMLTGRSIFKKQGLLLLPRSLINLEIQKYYQNKPGFNRVHSRDNLPVKIKDGAYVINLDEYADIGTHWVSLYLMGNKITYFDSFGVENIPEEIKNAISGSTITTNIFRI